MVFGLVSSVMVVLVAVEAVLLCLSGSSCSESRLHMGETTRLATEVRTADRPSQPS